MALTTMTLRPNATVQLGSATVAPSGAAHTALADSSDSTYVQLASRARLNTQVCRVSFADPVIPAGAKVYSVGIRRRIQTVASGSGRPTCHHWLTCSTGTIRVSGQSLDVDSIPWTSICPTSTAGGTWVDEDLGQFKVDPKGNEWTMTGANPNLKGMTYDMGRGDDFVPNLRISAVYLDIVYQQISTVTVTGPTSPSTATRPTITWLYASPDSVPQQGWRTAVYTAAQVAAVGFVAFTTPPLQASGWQLGETFQWTCTADLVDGDYVAYVQTTAQWSGSNDFQTVTASKAWTRAVTPASPPPSAVLTSATVDAVNNRVKMVITPGAGPPATNAYTVFATRDNGVHYDPIPSLTEIPADGTNPITVYDHVAPLNVDSRYYVISYTGDPKVGSIAPSNEKTVRPVDDRHWFKHPSNPDLNTPVVLATPSSGDGLKVTLPQTQATFIPLGGVDSEVLPIVLSGPSHGRVYQLEVLFIDESLAYWPAFEQLLKSRSLVLFQQPNGTDTWGSLGPGQSGRDTELSFDLLPGSPEEVFWRRVQVTFTQTKPPSYY